MNECGRALLNSIGEEIQVLKKIRTASKPYDCLFQDYVLKTGFLSARKRHLRKGTWNVTSPGENDELDNLNFEVAVRI